MMPVGAVLGSPPSTSSSSGGTVLVPVPVPAVLVVVVASTSTGTSIHDSRTLFSLESLAGSCSDASGE
jgi:hypothetical protein